MSEVHVLTVHEPYEVPGRPPVNATIVSAATLLHPDVPQPAGRQLYDALTRPRRADDELVPISTLAYELGGDLFAYAPDWEEASMAVIRLARDQACDAMPMSLPCDYLALMTNGPVNQVTLYDATGGQPRQLGPSDRARALADLQGHVNSYTAEGPFWPGYGDRRGEEGAG